MVNYKKYKHRRPGGRAGKMRLGHRVIWEKANGPIPDGCEVHHIDHDTSNNDLENLLVVTTSEHQRIHSPYYVKVNGVWNKFCGDCKEIKPSFTYRECNSCGARRARINRRLMKSVTSAGTL